MDGVDASCLWGELKAIKKVFKSKWLGKGPKTEEFIESFSSKLISSVFDGVAYTYPSKNNFLTVNCCTEGIFQIMDLAICSWILASFIIIYCLIKKQK